MKNIISAIVVLGISQAALAVEHGQVNSYSHQSTKKSVVRTSAKRAVPAPSAWTPPERVPSAPVQIYRKSQPKKLGGGFGFSSPTFSAPSFAAPAASAPTFGSPTFGSPNFSAPTFASPTTGIPTFSSPATSSPASSAPTFNSPSI